MADSSMAAATRELVAAVPELQEALDEHIRENEQILAHVFFGDVARYAGEVAHAGDERASGRLADALERMAATGDPDVLNVLQVSFVEYFEWGDEEDQAAFAWLSRFFGPAMLGCVEEFRAYEARFAAARPPRRSLGERLKSFRRSRLWKRQSRRAFERRARKLVGLQLDAVHYVGAVNSTGYAHSPGFDTTDFGVELVGDEGRYVYIRESGDFSIVISPRPMESRRSVWDVSSDSRWRPFVGRTVTNVDIASRMADESSVGITLVPERLLSSLVLRRRGQRLGLWLVERIGRDRSRKQYTPYGLTIHLGDRRVWLAAPREDDEGEYPSMSVVFEEDIARRLELVV